MITKRLDRDVYSLTEKIAERSKNIYFQIELIKTTRKERKKKIFRDNKEKYQEVSKKSNEEIKKSLAEINSLVIELNSILKDRNV